MDRAKPFLTLIKSAQEGGKPIPNVPAMKEWFKPFPHQTAAVRKLIENDGKMVLAHEMGTGKTVTSIYGFEYMRTIGRAKSAVVVVPSSLRENFSKEGIQKFTNSSYQVIGSSSERKRPGYVRANEIKRGPVYTIVSYAMFRRDPVGIMQRTGADTIIADEFHKTRNEQTSTFKAVAAARPYARNFIGLTASLVNNDPAEVASLLTLSEGERFISPKQFKRRYTRIIRTRKGGLFGGIKKERGLKQVEHMLRTVYPKVDYVSIKSLKSKTMPKKVVTEVDVPMSELQYKHYQYALDRLGPLARRALEQDPNASVKNKQLIFAQLMQARQLSNSVHMGRKDVTLAQSAQITPKVKRILDDTAAHLAQNKDGKVVLYSNLIRGGIDVLSAGLKDRGIDHALFVGKGTEIGKNKVTSETRDQGIEEFKAGKKKVIILSGAGAEGLSLKNATAFFALDGHFNPERILQAEARAIRLGGQKHRAVGARKVDVRRYKSTVPKSKKPGFFGKLIGRKTPITTDQWIYDTAKRKYTTNAKFYYALEHPHKYIRKYRDSKGNWRYVYPKDTTEKFLKAM